MFCTNYVPGSSTSLPHSATVTLLFLSLILNLLPSSVVQTSLTMAEACLLSLPSLFCNKTKHPHSSTFPSKPLKLQLSCSNSSLFLPSTSLIGRTHSSSILTFVAQTSDAAQQEADDAVAVGDEEPAWENQEVDNTEAGVSDWEAEGCEEGEYVEASEDAKIYVGNLPYDVDSQKLAMLFEQAGTVEIAEVIYNRETDRSRGFGFVTMSTVEEAEIAIEKFSRYDLNGRLLTVNKAAPRGSRPEGPPRAFEPAFRIHVRNLPWDVDNAGLEQMFRDQGKVLNARIVYDRETGRSRGFGFITMATETEMNNAIAALDGQSVDGRAIRVSAAEERPRRGNF